MPGWVSQTPLSKHPKLRSFPRPCPCHLQLLLKVKMGWVVWCGWGCWCANAQTFEGWDDDLFFFPFISKWSKVMFLFCFVFFVYFFLRWFEITGVYCTQEVRECFWWSWNIGTFPWFRRFQDLSFSNFDSKTRQLESCFQFKPKAKLLDPRQKHQHLSIFLETPLFPYLFLWVGSKLTHTY